MAVALAESIPIRWTSILSHLPSPTPQQTSLGLLFPSQGRKSRTVVQKPMCALARTRRIGPVSTPYLKSCRTTALGDDSTNGARTFGKHVVGKKSLYDILMVVWLRKTRTLLRLSTAMSAPPALRAMLNPAGRMGKCTPLCLLPRAT